MIPPITHVSTTQKRLSPDQSSNTLYPFFDNAHPVDAQPTGKKRKNVKKIDATAESILEVRPLQVTLLRQNSLIDCLSNSKNLQFVETSETGLFTFALFDREPNFLDKLNQYIPKQTDVKTKFLLTLQKLLNPLGKAIIPAEDLMVNLSKGEFPFKTHSSLALDLSLLYLKDYSTLELCAYREVLSRSKEHFMVLDPILTSLAVQCLHYNGSQIYKEFQSLFLAYQEFDQLMIVVKIGKREIKYENLTILTFFMLLSVGKPEHDILQVTEKHLFKPCLRTFKEDKVVIAPFAKYIFRTGKWIIKNKQFAKRFETYFVSAIAKECLTALKKHKGDVSITKVYFAHLLIILDRISKLTHPPRITGSLLHRRAAEFKYLYRQATHRSLKLKMFHIPEQTDTIWHTDGLYEASRSLRKSLVSKVEKRLGNFCYLQTWLVDNKKILAQDFDHLIALERNLLLFGKAPSKETFDSTLQHLNSLRSTYPSHSRTAKFQEFLALVEALILPPLIDEESLLNLSEEPAAQIYFNLAFNSPALYTKYLPLLLELFPLDAKIFEEIKSTPFVRTAYLHGKTLTSTEISLNEIEQSTGLMPVLTEIKEEPLHNDDLLELFSSITNNSNNNYTVSDLSETDLDKFN